MPARKTARRRSAPDSRDISPSRWMPPSWWQPSTAWPGLPAHDVARLRVRKFLQADEDPTDGSPSPGILHASVNVVSTTLVTAACKDKGINAVMGVSERAFLAGGGELGAMMRAFDWTSTPLGSPESWPQSLKTAVRIMLTSRQPIWIGWGDELIYLYNDPYKSIIGGRHPWALGQPTRLIWKEIWPEIAPMLAMAMNGDEGTYVEDQLLIMERNGYPEETYYTFSYSPIPDDDGGAGGIICANTDDTQRVIGERQINLLRELAARTVDARTPASACRQAANALATNGLDLPFALIYLGADDSGFQLAATAGIDADHPAAPALVGANDEIPWPLGNAVRAGESRLVGVPRAGTL